MCESAAIDFNALDLAQLVDHILETHHLFLRDHLPRLIELLDRIVEMHGHERPLLLAVRGVFRDFSREMYAHMEKEELILFPKITGRLSSFHPGCSLENILTVMEAEHRDAERDLKYIRNLLGDYQLPAQACETYRALIHELELLERDLEQHVYCENEVLFPRALAEAV